MYQVLSNNRVRKMPEMKPPDAAKYYNDEGVYQYADYRKAKTNYDLLINEQLVYPISGNHNWKEGQLIEEGKDFEFGFANVHEVTHEQYFGENMKRAYQTLTSKQVVIPIPKQAEPSTGSEEDELRKQLFEIIHKTQYASDDSMISAIVDLIEKREKTLTQ